MTRESPKRESERAQSEAGGRPPRTEAGSESLTVRECSRVKKVCWKAMGECVREVSGRKRSRRVRPKGREYMTRSSLSGRVVQDSLGGMLILS